MLSNVLKMLSNSTILVSTLLKLLGEKKAYLYAYNLKKKILLKLKKHGKKAEDLISTIEFILERKF